MRLISRPAFLRTRLLVNSATGSKASPSVTESQIGRYHQPARQRRGGTLRAPQCVPPSVYPWRSGRFLLALYHLVRAPGGRTGAPARSALHRPAAARHAGAGGTARRWYALAAAWPVAPPAA